MSNRPTSAQQQALTTILANGGEAIRHGPYFYSGGVIVGDAGIMERMAARGLLRLETIGASTFAVPVSADQEHMK